MSQNINNNQDAIATAATAATATRPIACTLKSVVVVTF